MKSLSALSLLLLLSACVSLGSLPRQPMPRESMDSASAADCSEEGAFQLGFNDGDAEKPMNGDWTKACTAPDEALARKSYRAGYLRARSLKPMAVYGAVSGGKGPGWMCKEAYGRKQCGYDCREAYGKIKCAKNVGSGCLEAFGDIKCGQNCREEFGKIVCDVED